MSAPSRIRRWLFLVTALTLLCVFGPTSQAAAAKYASMVIDADTGRILHAANADARKYPASLTKMMTLYMLFDALDRRKLSLNTKLRTSAHAAAQSPSKLNLKVGESITVKNAILALTTKSANDVAVVVAEAIGGSEAAFARMMTKRARALGMTRTTFRNASGLPNKGQRSTARDMAILALALLRHFPHHYRYFSTRKFTYKGKTYSNHNRLLGTYPGVDGIKTGYIRASGFNLVATSKRNGRRVIAVMFGGKTAAKRNAKVAELLNDGFRKLAMLSSSQPGTGETVGANLAKHTGSGRSAQAWAVQVGAFRVRKSAEETAHSAVHHVAAVMPDGQPTVLRSRRGNGTTFYLARIIGGEKAQAREACRVLVQNRFRCLVLRVNGRQASAAPAKTSGTAGYAAAAPGGSAAWAIQVGAFPGQKTAYAIAKRAVKTVPDTLSGGAIKVAPLPRQRRSTLYRARVVNITRAQAEESCRRLEGTDLPCMVLRL